MKQWVRIRLLYFCSISRSVINWCHCWESIRPWRWAWFGHAARPCDPATPPGCASNASHWCTTAFGSLNHPAARTWVTDCVRDCVRVCAAWCGATCRCSPDRVGPYVSAQYDSACEVSELVSVAEMIEKASRALFYTLIHSGDLNQEDSFDLFCLIPIISWSCNSILWTSTQSITLSPHRRANMLQVNGLILNKER